MTPDPGQAAPGPDGVLAVDKPPGPTSHDVVGMARRALGTRRVGHTGTLDPFASGLLLLCVGPSTRLSQYLTGMDKSYRATARLGETTDTLDTEGEVVARDEVWRDLDEAAVEAAVAELVGTGPQTPPAFSAKKVGGEAAHRKARRGEVVTLDPVTVTVHEAELESWDPPDLRFRVRCSSGTYIRALARDLGLALGTGAYLTALRRDSVGPFTVDEALAVGDLQEGRGLERLLNPAVAVAHLARVTVDDADAMRLVQGQRIALLQEDPGEGEPVAVLWADALLAIAQVRNGELQPRKVFSQGPGS